MSLVVMAMMSRGGGERWENPKCLKCLTKRGLCEEIKLNRGYFDKSVLESVVLRGLGECSFSVLGASRSFNTSGSIWAIWVGQTSAIVFRQDIPALVNDCSASALAFLSGVPCGLGRLFGAG